MFKIGSRIGKRIRLTLFLSSYFLIAYALLNYFDITCVFLKLFGVPCPGCGMTRAFLAMLKLDFYSAAKHNIVIFFMPYVFMYVYFDFKHRIHKVLLSMVAIVAIINWLIKMITFI